MAQAGVEKVAPMDERQRLLQENNRMRRDLETFQKNEEQATAQIKTLEKKVDGLEFDKYKLLEEINTLKCDVNLKETEVKRLNATLNKMKEQCIAIEAKYAKQKEKIESIQNAEKDFFKGLQEVIDYYYDCLLSYARFSTKSLCKLMVNEPLNIQGELKDEFVTKYNTLKILNGSIDIPSVKVKKQQLFRNLQQRVAFFQDIDFEKNQMAFDKLLDEMKNQGVKLEIGDMNVFLDNTKKRELSKKGSVLGNPYDDNSFLDNSALDVNTSSNSMFLADLEKSENQLNTSGIIKSGGFSSLGEHLNAIKKDLKGKIDETKAPDYEMINKVLKEVNDLMEFINNQVDIGQSDKKAVAATPRPGGKGANYSEKLDNILDDLEPGVSPQAVREMVTRIKDKMMKLKENSSVRPEDLILLEKLLDRKDEINFEWNKLEILQLRLGKKVNFLAEFIKDKEVLLHEKKIELDKLQLLFKEMTDSIHVIMKELRDVEEEKNTADNDLQRIKKDKLRITTKIDLTKREINKIRSSTSAEEAKMQSIKDDLDMITNSLTGQKDKETKLKEEAEKLEKKVQAFNQERNQSLQAVFRQEIEEMLLNEKKTIMSSMTKVSEQSGPNSTGKSSTVFFSLKDLHGSVSSSEQIPKAKEILENKIKQILDIIDKVESKESAKDIILKNQDSIQYGYIFGPFFVLFYRSLLLLFFVSLKLVDNDEGRIGLLKTLNETLLNTQMLDSKIKNWDSIAQMKSKILDFQLDIENSLAGLASK